MRAALIRVGVDQAYGRWNAPVDPETGDFVYVPIPEGPKAPVQQALATTYDAVEPELRAFATRSKAVGSQACSLPSDLRGAVTHLDPDFRHLTYGDNGERRGKGITDFGPGDVLAFYAGLRPIRRCEHRLIYALIGLYRVAEVVRVASVPRERWSENAHLRRQHHRATDVIVRAAPGSSGRLRWCLPIGEFRNGAYRVRMDLLNRWGGLSCRDGFIQRSAVPPMFLHPERFMAWFEQVHLGLIAAN
ncbi:hypothetical protein [Anaeromyxobacter sp. PSR-1]|uniref:Nmad3 family putative nucleotide modification protein n=1 Tax=Anaeromyxobacter sp. PSR-1 TaxID=1300915 RepID=UPI00126A6898|nr:hypothetical protein [Anaeromyxobacter sp. PSR-1]